MLQQYLRWDYEKQLKIDKSNIAIHVPCVSHCLRLAFGDCTAPHPDITHAINHYIKLGYEIKVEKPKLGTIPGITSWNEWKWPDDENEPGFICARGLPEFGQWNIFSLTKIEKIIKSHKIVKLQPATSPYSIPTKSWTTPIPGSTKSILKNKSDFDSFYAKYGTSTHRLNERTITRWPNILYKVGHKKKTKNQAKETNLLRLRLVRSHCWKQCELEPEEVPRLSTMQNWITKTASVMKQRLSKQMAKEAEMKI
ncbi:9910_t:CDS:2 [Gigaspora rosea]|nr:9910_t:CDS:2 [Gigaspora rosea]